MYFSSFKTEFCFIKIFGHSHINYVFVWLIPPAYFFQCCSGFDGAVVAMKDQKNPVEDVANEAVNLLWNLW